MIPLYTTRLSTLYRRKRSARKLLAQKQEQRIVRELLKTLRVWNITARERHKLLRLRASEYEQMKYGGVVPKNKETIFCIIEIRKIERALRSLLGKNNNAVAHWIHSPNRGKIFGGRPAITLMCKDSNSLSSVRQYLEYHAYNGW